MMQSIRHSMGQHAAPYVRALVIIFTVFSIQIPATNAAMVGTESLITIEADRAKVAEFLQRDYVQQALIDQGVDASAALDRVDRLTDTEIASLAEQIDEMPAGGSIVGAILLVFFVLLITDLLGLTHVYPFVNR